MSRSLIIAAVIHLAVAVAARADVTAYPAPPHSDTLTPVGFPGPPQSFVDLDQLATGEVLLGSVPGGGELWSWQVLPHGLIYESYLANTKESRMAIHFFDPQDEAGWLIDATVGGRVGMFRYGTSHPVRPEGIQLDLEGSAHLRLDPEEDRDLRSVDFRFGLPLSFGVGRSRWKFGYYHLSSHLGDEFLIKNPGFPRLNFSRDVLVLGYAYYLTPKTRLYTEAGFAVYSDVSDPWEFQFGLDHAPIQPTGPRGAPFWAVHGHLREEVDFGGSLTAQAGWAWRSDLGSPLLRTGLHYFNGKSNQFSFHNEHEHQVGLALWYDY